MDASLTVTVAFRALLTLGRIMPLKKAELVPTKYTTTTSRIRIPTIQAIARSQRRGLRCGGELTVASAIKESFVANHSRHLSAQPCRRSPPGPGPNEYTSACCSVIERLPAYQATPGRPPLFEAEVRLSNKTVGCLVWLG